MLNLKLSISTIALNGNVQVPTLKARDGQIGIKKSKPNYLLLVADRNKSKENIWTKIWYADTKGEKPGMAQSWFCIQILHHASMVECCPHFGSSFRLQVPPGLKHLPKKSHPQDWDSSLTPLALLAYPWTCPFSSFAVFSPPWFL